MPNERSVQDLQNGLRFCLLILKFSITNCHLKLRLFSLIRVVKNDVFLSHRKVIQQIIDGIDGINKYNVMAPCAGKARQKVFLVPKMVQFVL